MLFYKNYFLLLFEKIFYFYIYKNTFRKYFIFFTTILLFVNFFFIGDLICSYLYKYSIIIINVSWRENY
jgi:hypothetical protein